MADARGLDAIEPHVIDKETEMTSMLTLDPVTAAPVAPSAVAWLNERRALVATMSHDGAISTCEISRGSLSEGAYLHQVVRVIGDRQRVVILGPGTVRLELEREYVALFRRPDRLVDVEPAGPVDMQAVVDRLSILAG
jgi:hypothetical protein